MIKFENTEVMGWEAVIRGMRNPMNSWEKSDSGKIYWNGTWYTPDPVLRSYFTDYGMNLLIGPNDLDLMRRLAAGGPVHAKYRRMITVYVDITAPLYWWKEFDTYRVSVEKNSCSTMHKIHAKEFTLEDFSHEHLDGVSRDMLYIQIEVLNRARKLYLETKDKKYWWQMIQLLPSSYNQKRTVMLNYEVLAHIWNDRRRHKLDEWSWHEGIIDGDKTNKAYIGFCDWIKTLPYSELITGIEPGKKQVCKDCFGAEMDDCDKCPHKTKK